MAAPDWPASVENIVASVAIVAGGGWAAWKWGYGETLRRRREFPDLDGTLTAASVPPPGGQAYVTLQAVWRNPGPVPVPRIRGGRSPWTPRSAARIVTFQPSPPASTRQPTPRGQQTRALSRA